MLYTSLSQLEHSASFVKHGGTPRNSHNGWISYVSIPTVTTTAHGNDTPTFLPQVNKIPATSVCPHSGFDSVFYLSLINNFMAQRNHWNFNAMI